MNLTYTNFSTEGETFLMYSITSTSGPEILGNLNLNPFSKYVQVSTGSSPKFRVKRVAKYIINIPLSILVYF